MTPEQKEKAIGSQVVYEGHVYRVLGLGVEREDGTIYAHLASTTDRQQQANGSVPRQINVFVPTATILRGASGEGNTYL